MLQYLQYWHLIVLRHFRRVHNMVQQNTIVESQNAFKTAWFVNYLNNYILF